MLIANRFYNDIVYNSLEGEIIESFKGNLRKGIQIAFIVEANKKTPLESYKGESIYFLTKLLNRNEGLPLSEEERNLRFAKTEFTPSLVGERNVEKMRRIKASFNRKSKI